MMKLKTVKVKQGTYNLVQGKEILATFTQGLGGNYEGVLPNKCKVIATSVKAIVSMSEMALR